MCNRAWSVLPSRRVHSRTNLFIYWLEETDNDILTSRTGRSRENEIRPISLTPNLIDCPLMDPSSIVTKPEKGNNKGIKGGITIVHYCSEGDFSCIRFNCEISMLRMQFIPLSNTPCKSTEERMKQCRTPLGSTLDRRMNTVKGKWNE